MTCSNRSEREKSYDIITTSINSDFGDTFVPNKEVGDTFVPYMEVMLSSRFERLNNWMIHPLIINENHQMNDVIFRVNRESLGSNANKYGGF